jgi:photosystem II stability/assembly factor-like uncharacterized protein
MKNNKGWILLFAIVMMTLTIGILLEKRPESTGKRTEKIPNDWFFQQRSFPYNEINYEARKLAWQHSQTIHRADAGRGEGWVFQGPLNIGGRISAVAMPASDMQTIYAGAASGGIFKSTNGGGSWDAIFEDELSLSIGDIVIAPSDENILYVGTGEANAGGGSMAYDGFGIYRSDDAGDTWQHLGLEDCGSVGRVEVHPNDPLVCFVAAMGRLFSNNPERGVFRTTDGGSNWEKVLFLNDSTGAIDIVIHPDDPDIIYASMWERVRRPNRRDYGGPSSGLYRSFDGGDTWSEMTSGLPNDAYVGRIGIDIAEADPDVLYAIYADDIGYFDGVYKTTNGGNSWIRTNDGDLSNMYSSYGWWFGRISVDPVNPNVAYAIGFDLYKTSSGGNSWSMISAAVHVDQHDLVAHPQNPSHVVLGNDGGIYISDNAGSSWTFLQNMPITQFYTCEVDEQHPERFYGGTQDNGTNRTMTGNDDDWQSIYWGDGFYVLVDPVDNNYIYAEYQYGSFARSTNGGYSFNTAMTGISGSDRKNWNTPFIIDPQDEQILYFGANRLYKTTNRAVSWTAISPDLTNGGGGVNVTWSTITTIAAAPSNNQWIYVGTDDGNVWRTSNGGGNWTKISDDLPVRWVTRVAVDPYDENTAYVTLSGYRYDSYLPHVFRSTDGGGIWEDISGNLPDVPVNDIIVDPSVDSAIYIATDFGVYVSWNLGQNWLMLGDNLPNVPIVDLRLHQPTHTLVAATYGRSMYSFNLDQLVSVGSEGMTRSNNLKIYPNPATNEVYVESGLLDGPLEYAIFGLQGNVYQTGTLSPASGRSRIEISELAAGNYTIRIMGKTILAGKFIKVD